MKFILISTQNKNIIPITSFPITIGRESEILNSKEADEDSQQALRHISKKHATLSQKADAFFLNDAGSLNGTFLNNQRIFEEDIRLNPGDILSLAQKIDFIVDCDTSAQNYSADESVLLPEDENHQQIELDHFPFFLGEKLFDETIHHPLGTSTNRAECVLSAADEKLFIAPLNRKHNVRVHGKKIPFGHTQLAYNDLISLAPGQEFRLSRKHVPIDRQEEKTETDINTEPEEDRTIYMEDATMFMNFFDYDEQKKGNVAESITDSPGKTGNTFPDTTKKILTNKIIRSFFIGVLVLLAVIVGIIFFYRSSNTHQANNLYKSGQYEECVITSDNALAEKSNKKLSEIGTKSLLKLIIPAFRDSLEKNNYSDFNIIIERYKAISSNISGAHTILDLFLFMSKVDSFADLHKTSYSIDDEEWKTGTISINQEWRKSQNEYKPVIDEINQLEPQLSETIASFFSKINTNQENEIYFINKITDLETDVQSLLQKKDFDSADKLVKKFSSTHSKLTNTDKWTSDLALYVSLVELLDNIDLFDIASVNETETPQTALFKRATQDYIREKIPAQQISQQIALAKRYWKNGQPDKAKALLEELPETVIQEMITEKILFLDQVISYQQKLENPETESDCVVIAAFFKFLENENTLLKTHHQEQFTTCRSQAQKLISNHSRKAETAYEQYKTDGAISGQMRMEPKISNHFQKQAQLLATAVSEASFVKKTAELFDIMLLKKTTVTFIEMAKEHDTQLVRISGSAILSGTLKHEKLALFELNEVNGWQD